MECARCGHWDDLGEHGTLCVHCDSEQSALWDACVGLDPVIAGLTAANWLPEASALEAQRWQLFQRWVRMCRGEYGEPTVHVMVAVNHRSPSGVECTRCGSWDFDTVCHGRTVWLGVPETNEEGS